MNDGQLPPRPQSHRSPVATRGAQERDTCEEHMLRGLEYCRLWSVVTNCVDYYVDTREQ